jgi:hypothetical protein
VWNYYNRTRRQLYKIDATASWTYNAATWRQWNNSSSAKLEFVIGWVEDLTCLTFTGMVNAGGSGVYGSLGIGLDSITTNNALVSTQGGNASERQALIATYEAMFSVGYHYLALMEYGHASVVTFYGQPASYNTYQSGAIGHVMA